MIPVQRTGFCLTPPKRGHCARIQRMLAELPHKLVYNFTVVLTPQGKFVLHRKSLVLRSQTGVTQILTVCFVENFLLHRSC
jgi:hypothetical protein